MSGGQGPIHVDDEARVADEMARELEALAAESHGSMADGFADRVMGAIAREPLPQPARAFGAALAARRLGAAIASVGDAWRVIVGGQTPIAVRAQAFALVLVVVVASLGVAGGATVGAIDLLNATQPSHPTPTTPAPSVAPESPSPSPSPSPDLATPEPTTVATPTDGETETPDGTGQPGSTDGIDGTATPTPTGTDDHGGNGGSGETAKPTATSTATDGHGDGGGTDDHGGGGGGGGETPSATATDDHGGGGGGGSGE